MKDLSTPPEYQGEILAALNEKLTDEALNRRALAWALRGAGSDSDYILRELALRDALLEVAILSVSMLTARVDHERTASDTAFYLLQHIDAFAQRGKKVLEGAAKGHQATHGDAQQKAAKWAKYQEEVDRLAAANPRLSFEDIKKKVAAKFDVSESTIKRHTTNPKVK